MRLVITVCTCTCTCVHAYTCSLLTQPHSGHRIVKIDCKTKFISFTYGSSGLTTLSKWTWDLMADQSERQNECALLGRAKQAPPRDSDRSCWWYMQQPLLICMHNKGQVVGRAWSHSLHNALHLTSTVVVTGHAQAGGILWLVWCVCFCNQPTRNTKHEEQQWCSEW